MGGKFRTRGCLVPGAALGPSGSRRGPGVPLGGLSQRPGPSGHSGAGAGALHPAQPYYCLTGRICLNAGPGGPGPHARPFEGVVCTLQLNPSEAETPWRGGVYRFGFPEAEDALCLSRLCPARASGSFANKSPGRGGGLPSPKCCLLSDHCRRRPQGPGGQVQEARASWVWVGKPPSKAGQQPLDGHHERPAPRRPGVGVPSSSPKTQVGFSNSQQNPAALRGTETDSRTCARRPRL